MATSPDIRLSCGETSNNPKKFLGGCIQFFTTASGIIKIATNTTKMLYIDSSSFVDPFVTKNTPISQPDCSTYDSTDPCGDGTNGQLWCHQDITDSYFEPSSSSSSSFQVGRYHNNYIQTDITQSIDNCSSKIGFKNLYASKVHQGIVGFTSDMHHKNDYWDWCCDNCGYRNVKSSADQTKYKTLTVSVVQDAYKRSNSGYVIVDDYFTYCCDKSDPSNCIPCTEGDPNCECDSFSACYTTSFTDHYYGATADSTCTVDDYGNVTGTCSSSSYGGEYICPGYLLLKSECGGDPGCEAYYQGLYDSCSFSSNSELALNAYYYLFEGNSDFTNLIQIFSDFVNGINCSEGAQPTPTTVTGDGSSWHLTWSKTRACHCRDSCNCCMDTDTDYNYQTVDITSTSLSIKKYGLLDPRFVGSGYCTNDERCYDVILLLDETWSYSNTSYTHIKSTYDSYAGAAGGYNTITVTATLSDPHTTTQVNESLKTLLGMWHLGDDTEMPWRTGNDVSRGPHVRYDETHGVPTSPFCSSDNTTGYSSNIIGAPCPIVGIDRVWDPDHKNYCVCDSISNPGCYVFWTSDYGAWSTDIGVPRATNWLDVGQANQMPGGGAFTGHGFMYTTPSSCAGGETRITDDPTMWACKYAEIIYPKQSYNYARPCGIDKIQFSASNAWCVASNTPTEITIDSITGPILSTFTSQQKLIVQGVSGIADGIYYATRTSDYVATVGDCVASSSWFVNPIIENAGTGLIAILRWNDIIPGVCGKSTIISATQSNISSSVVCTIEDDGYFFNNDQIRIEGSNLNGYYNIKPLSSRTFELKNTAGTLYPSYNGGGLVSYPFGADWKWNDTTSKNDFVVHTWDMDFRSYGEWIRVSSVAANNASSSRLCCPGPNVTAPDCEYPDPLPNDCPQPTVPTEPYKNVSSCLGYYIQSSTAETTCLPFSACSPSVAYFSPNEEKFDAYSSKNYGFKFQNFDSDYGTMWQGAIKQVMDDPLFQQSPCVCSDAGGSNFKCECATLEDNGTCLSDTVTPCKNYYPMRNVYEARNELPTGSPPFVDGKDIGCVTTENIGRRHCNTSSFACNAPAAYGFFPSVATCDPYRVYPWQVPWYYKLAKQGCVCAEGRFADEYKSNGVKC